MRQCGWVAGGVLGVLAIAASCGASSSSTGDGAGPEVIGTREDMQSRRGRHDGYMLLTQCPTAIQSAIAIVADGATPFEFIAEPESEPLREAFRTRVAAALSGVNVRSTGFGAPCTGVEPAFHIGLNDWHEVDPTVNALGAWVAREGLRGQIVIYVVADPVVN